MPTSQQYQKRLAWLNSTGGWEYWNFLARKTYGYTMGKSDIVERDIFQDWDTDFITGNAQNEALSIIASENLIVRSQFLSDQQIDAIARIRLSISVRDVDRDVVVTIDPSSFEYRTDAQRQKEIEFTIKYPSQQIQSL